VANRRLDDLLRDLLHDLLRDLLRELFLELIVPEYKRIELALEDFVVGVDGFVDTSPESVVLGDKFSVVGHELFVFGVDGFGMVRLFIQLDGQHNQLRSEMAILGDQLSVGQHHRCNEFDGWWVSWFYANGVNNSNLYK
jgi:hypothetical protein